MAVALTFLFSSSLLVTLLFFGRVSHRHGADCRANNDPGRFSTTWTHQRVISLVDHFISARTAPRISNYQHSGWNGGVYQQYGIDDGYVEYLN